jgi:uncharacterized membrane protein YtjA (UPF0391 family)
MAAAVLGFGGVAVVASGIAMLLFFFGVFLVMLMLDLMGRRTV